MILDIAIVVFDIAVVIVDIYIAVVDIDLDILREGGVQRDINIASKCASERYLKSSLYYSSVELELTLVK